MRSTLLLASLSLLAPSLASDCHGGFGVASNPGDTCESFAKQWKITVDELKRLNPGVTCPDLPYINDTYCVRESEKTTTSDSSESTSTSTSSSGSTETVLVSTSGASATPTGVSSGSASKTTPAASASGSAAPAQSSAAPSGSSGAEVRAVGSFGLVAGIAGVFALL
jgi:cobalamin biosynthesis Mg chelatase CobN